MAFFPRSLYNSEPSSFTPLFRLLDDFDNYSRQGTGQQHGRRGQGLPAWQPKFDIRETEDHYELHGELAGVEKDKVHIEFTDPQTMLVRGRVERSYTAGTPPAGQLEEGSTGGDEGRASHRATVEDADDDEGDGQAKPASEGDGAVATRGGVEDKKRPAAKYWLTERSVGEFSRSFNFPTRIDQDAVTASFKDGILSIAVPKAKKHESRRIAIE